MLDKMKRGIRRTLECPEDCGLAQAPSQVYPCPIAALEEREK